MKTTQFRRFINATRGCGKTTKLIEAMLVDLKAGKHITLIIVERNHVMCYKAHKELKPYLNQINFIPIQTVLTQLNNNLDITDPQLNSTIRFDYTTYISHEVYEWMICKLLQKQLDIKNILESEKL